MFSTARGLEFFDLLTAISFVLQLQSYEELRNQATTDDIFQELQRQDRKYLDRIIENQEKILKILTTRHTDG